MRDVIDLARGRMDSIEGELKEIKELLQHIKDPRIPPR
jgi:hypothetical protein